MIMIMIMIMMLSQKKIDDEGIKIVHAFSPIQINKVTLENGERGFNIGFISTAL